MKTCIKRHKDKKFNVKIKSAYLKNRNVKFTKTKQIEKWLKEQKEFNNKCNFYSRGVKCKKSGQFNG